MSSTMELDGIDQIISRLESMGKASSRIEGDALKDGAQLIVDEAKNNLERNGMVRTGELIAGLKVSNMKRKGNRKYVQAGIQKGDNSNIFYGKFHEYGTSKMAARPFLAPAYESKKMEARNIIMNRLRSALKL